MLSIRITSVLVVFVFLAGGLIAADSGKALMKDGKKGEINIGETVKVGDITLPAGKYTVQHRVHGEEHLMHFTLNGSEETEQTAPVRCERSPKGKRWPSSSVWLTVKDGEKALEKVMIQGEKIVYNFQ